MSHTDVKIANGIATETDTFKLKKQLGLYNGVTLIVGIIVGSGIFVSPKGVLQEAGSVGSSLLIWGLCGLICLVGALCYSELGTSILKSGGDYSYINEAFGDLPSFLYLWVAIVIIFPVGNAVTAITFANYILQPVFTGCGPPDIAITLLAASCITLLTLVNCVNVKWATRVQDIFTVTKVLALLVIIVTGLVMICMGSVESFDKPFATSTSDPSRFALAFYSGLFSYSGWTYLNMVTEELKDPYRNLPRAIWISLPLITTIYLLTNIAYFAVMSPLEMLESDAVAVTFADRTLGVMRWIMPIFVAFSTFGGLNGAIFTSARLYFVGARAGHLPGFLATINMKFMTPLPSLLFGCVMSLVYVCISDVYMLITYGAFVESVFIGTSVAGLLYLRYTRPDMKRPIKVNIVFPVFFLVVCVFLLITPLASSPKSCFIGLVMIATGVPVYMVAVLWTNKPRRFLSATEKLTVIIQKLFFAAREELKEE